MAEKQMGSHSLWITGYRLETMGDLLEVGYHSLQIIISRSQIIDWGCRLQTRGLQIIGCRLQNIDQGLEVIEVIGCRLQNIDQGLEVIGYRLQIRGQRVYRDQRVRCYRLEILDQVQIRDQRLEVIGYGFQIRGYRLGSVKWPCLWTHAVFRNLQCPCSLQESLVFPMCMSLGPL